jgi:hypothetical protein
VLIPNPVTSNQHLAEAFLTKLRTDFAGERKLFAESQYRDPAIRQALLLLKLVQRGMFHV